MNSVTVDYLTSDADERASFFRGAVIVCPPDWTRADIAKHIEAETGGSIMALRVTAAETDQLPRGWPMHWSC